MFDSAQGWEHVQPQSSTLGERWLMPVQDQDHMGHAVGGVPAVRERTWQTGAHVTVWVITRRLKTMCSF